MNSTRLIKIYLRDRKQFVVLDGQCSRTNDIRGDVPQGPILGPILFLIYMNDLSRGPEIDLVLFTDYKTIIAHGQHDG